MPRKAQIASVADEDAAPGGAAAVDRAISLLTAFRSTDKGLSLAELAQRTQLYKSTVLRLLASLMHAKLVHQAEDGRYLLGSGIAKLYGVFMASFSLERVVMPVLRRLMAATGESAAYHVRQGEARLCLYRVDSPHPVRDHTRAGDVLPTQRGTGARVLLAYHAGAPEPATPKEEKLYASIRKQGYYAATGDRLADVSGIAAPVFHADGRIAAALTLTMPADRYDERYIEHVLKAAAELNGQV